MEMKIEKMPDCRIAYIRKIGVYGEHNKQMMEKIKN
jgi:DNA gyrase inhibitor GyrI